METMTARVVGIGEAHRLSASRPPHDERPVVDAAANMYIDGWLVEPALNALTRGESHIRLRAQLMDLLLCLASHPGKVFSRNEIVARVWDGRWIAESALSRCIAELRSALGDEAHRPRVIQTITKRGYRLIAPVQAVPVSDAAASPLSAAARTDPLPRLAAHEGEPPRRSLWRRVERALRLFATFAAFRS